MGDAGCGLRVAGYGLRVTGYELRVASYGLRVTSCGVPGLIKPRVPSLLEQKQNSSPSILSRR